MMASPKYCRICENESDLELIFSAKNREIPDKLLKFAEISIRAGDGLPKHLCASCIDNLDFSYNFRLLCQLSDKKLRDTLGKHHTVVDDHDAPTSQEEIKYEIETVSVEDAEVKEEELDTDDDEEIGPNSFTAETTYDGFDMDTIIEEDLESAADEPGSSKIRKSSRLSKQQKTKESFEKEFEYVSKETQNLESHDSTSGDKKSAKEEQTESRNRAEEHNKIEKKDKGEELTDNDAGMCIHCNINFSTLDEILEHCMEMHPPPVCTDCGDVFESESDLEVHRIEACSKKIPFSLRYVKRKRTQKMCMHCKIFIDVDKFDQHKLTNCNTQKIPCDKCDMEFESGSALIKHRKIHLLESRTHKCPKCSKAFKHKYKLIAHIKVHNTDNPYKCEFCGESFASIDFLKNHESNLHYDNQNVFSCKSCEVTYPDILQLVRHLRWHVINGDEIGEYDEIQNADILKPPECNICGRQFSTNILLRMHMARHNFSMPYKCDVCDKQFSHVKLLKQHRKDHMDRPKISCKLCSKVFKGVYSLREHMRTHTQERPFECDICGKTFLRSSNLFTHMDVHSTTRDFQCQYCGKQFTSRTSRADHERIHTGNYRYKCSQCPKGFNKRLDYVRHLRLHHSEEQVIAHESTQETD